MEFASPLLAGHLIRRYKRFLADVRLTDGRLVTAHCANTGSMLGCDRPGSAVWLSPSTNPKRKLPYTWELVEVSPGVLVGIHTGRANGLVRDAVAAGRIAALAGYGEIRAEVPYGRERSRIDLLYTGHHGRPDCYVEVKNVTAALADGTAFFPDAVSIRGTKHLRELTAMAAAGYRAMVVFCVQRGDARNVRPADDIDPAYGAALRAALQGGVEALAWRAEVSPEGIHLATPLPVHCP